MKEWSVPLPCRRTSGGRHGTRPAGGWVGPKVGLDALEKCFMAPCGKQSTIPRPTAHSLVTVPTTPSGRRLGWKDNIKMEGVDWVNLTHNASQWLALRKTVMGVWVP